MAIATNQGHVNRAIEFYNKVSKYFAIGRTTAWEDETNPPSPEVSAFKVDELVGFKRVDHCYLVVEDPNGTIDYRTEKWRSVPVSLNTTVGSSGVAQGSTSVVLTSLSGITVNSKLRIANTYEGKVLSISSSTNTVTLDTAAPSAIPGGSAVLGGALVENAKYIYIDCYLNYDDFPLVTYRQIGVSTGVTPSTEDILLSAEYSATSADEFTNPGTLEVLDNRKPTSRQIDQKELIALIIEM